MPTPILRQGARPWERHCCPSLGKGGASLSRDWRGRIKLQHYKTPWDGILEPGGCDLSKRPDEGGSLMGGGMMGGLGILHQPGRVMF